MCKGLYTILITINIVTTIAISSFCFVLFFCFFVCLFFIGPLGYQFYYYPVLSSSNKVLPTKTCHNDLKITMHSIIQLTYQLWSHGVPSFFTLPFSLSPVIAEPQTGII